MSNARDGNSLSYATSLRWSDFLTKSSGTEGQDKPLEDLRLGDMWPHNHRQEQERSGLTCLCNALHGLARVKVPLGFRFPLLRACCNCCTGTLVLAAQPLMFEVQKPEYHLRRFNQGGVRC